MSERPWWFPTAVFVAPVCATAAGFALWLWVQHEPDWWLVSLLVVIGALAVPFIHLARREDRWRDGTRPAHLNRWGFDRTIHPWLAMGRVIATAAAVIGALAGCVALISAAPEGAKVPFSIIVGAVGVVALITWYVVSASRMRWNERPEWQTALVWRWPVTTAMAVGAFTGVFLLGTAWSVAHGAWITLPAAILLFAQPFIRSLIRLLDPRHPDRNWGKRVAT